MLKEKKRKEKKRKEKKRKEKKKNITSPLTPYTSSPHTQPSPSVPYTMPITPSSHSQIDLIASTSPSKHHFPYKSLHFFPIMFSQSPLQSPIVFLFPQVPGSVLEKKRGIFFFESDDKYFFFLKFSFVFCRYLRVPLLSLQTNQCASHHHSLPVLHLHPFFFCFVLVAVNKKIWSYVRRKKKKKKERKAKTI